MFEDDDQPTPKSFTRHEHHRCRYYNGPERCPRPAECITHYETRRIIGVSGRKRVGVGYCGDHYRNWHEKRDRRASDQMLDAYLRDELIAEPNVLRPLIEQRMENDPLCDMIAKHPPQNDEDRRRMMGTIVGTLIRRLR